LAIATTPTATYRLQVSRGLTLARARALVDYLRELGVSHLYLSPLLAATPGSTHGYDVIDHSRVSPDLGTEEDLQSLAGALHEADMGAVVDLVPNHMCIADVGNRQWNEVLEYGEEAAANEFFDIDWGPPKAELAGKVLLPVLGEQFGRELEKGAVKVAFEDGAFHLEYGPRRFPLTPNSWRLVLEPIWRRVKERAGDDAPEAVEVESILRSLAH
jgi:(1->4)-alpha-D-glucan 1-alpha-D-glucosylmutase